MQNKHNSVPPPEVQKLIANSDLMQLNALYEDNQSDSSKDALYLNLKLLHKARSKCDSGGSGYNHSDKSMDYDTDDTESMAILNTLSSDIEAIETPLVKCCDAFWNLFKYISICLSLFWILFLLLMLMEPSMNNIRSIISYIDPIAARNRPVQHRINSKESCSTYDMNKFSQEFNVYLLFHFGRWFVYSLLYRNRLILWINSILWELIQFFIASLSVFNLQWIGQCWYNSIIFDVLLTNMLGIELGYIAIKRSQTLTLYHVFNEIFECKISFFKSFICIWCTIVLFQLEELLMFIIFDQTFWYNTNGWMIWCRLFIYSLSTLFCVHQLFYWIKDNGLYQLQSISWVIILNSLVLSELLIAIKTYSSEYQ